MSAPPAVIEYRLGSVEFARAEVTSKTRTGAALVTLAIEIAITPKGTKPTTEWAAATWEGSPGTNKAVARLLHTWDTLGQFDVHSRLTDMPQIPIKYAGIVKVV